MDVSFLDRSVRKFTELGDPTLLLCGGLGVFFCLWTQPTSRRIARDWAVAFGLCIALTISSKIFFYFADAASGVERLRSPSGHVAIATTFYGGCALLLTFSNGTLTRVLASVVTALFLLALAGSRVVLGLHTLSEVAVAFFIGIFCFGVFAHRLDQGSSQSDAGQLATLLLLLVVTRFARIDAEGFIAFGAKNMIALQRMVELRGHGISP